MAGFTPKNPAYAQRVRESFLRQGFMQLLGAELEHLEPGRCEIRLGYRPALCQQHGFFHGGVIGTLADTAGSYACFTLMGTQDSLLTVEYKLNLLAPGDGKQLIARAEVLRNGRNIVVARTDVFSSKADKEKPCATALITTMTLPDKPDHPHP